MTQLKSSLTINSKKIYSNFKGLTKIIKISQKKYNTKLAINLSVTEMNTVVIKVLLNKKKN